VWLSIYISNSTIRKRTCNLPASSAVTQPTASLCAPCDITLLTYSMEHSPREANWFSASQEISRNLWNLKVHYRIRKCLQPVPTLSQIDLFHAPTSHLLKCDITYHMETNTHQTNSFSFWQPVSSESASKSTR
jgi:hypothetical protein